MQDPTGHNVNFDSYFNEPDSNKDDPLYTHDCDICTYLGHYKEHDLYYCPQGGNPTFIARYDDEGGSYESGRVFAAVSVVLGETVRRAHLLGLWYTTIGTQAELDASMQWYDKTYPIESYGPEDNLYYGRE